MHVNMQSAPTDAKAAKGKKPVVDPAAEEEAKKTADAAAALLAAQAAKQCAEHLTAGETANRQAHERAAEAAVAAQAASDAALKVCCLSLASFPLTVIAPKLCDLVFKRFIWVVVEPTAGFGN
jgi:hypothetical protein